MMLIMFNLINEAGTRVPGVVGTSLGTVSGLILGQAAVEANLIHPLLIIVVAVSSLGSYALPDYELSLTFRMGQLLFLLAACLAGLYGMAALMLIVLVRLCALTSLGAPYLAPLAPRRPRNPDLLLRPAPVAAAPARLPGQPGGHAPPLRPDAGLEAAMSGLVSNPHPGPFPLDGTGPAAGGRALLPAGGIAAVPAGNRPVPGGYRALCPNGGGRYLDDAPVHAAGTGTPGHRGPVQALHRRPHPHRSLPGGAASLAAVLWRGYVTLALLWQGEVALTEVVCLFTEGVVMNIAPFGMAAVTVSRPFAAVSARAFPVRMALYVYLFFGAAGAVVF